jgi:hypothetical protein
VTYSETQTATQRTSERQETRGDAKASPERSHVEMVQRARRVGMFTERRTITPAFAEMILQRYAPAGTNRRLRASYAASIAAEIGKGRWNPNTHQGIAFTDGGILSDGQHRLTACVLAGLSITLPVTYGQPEDVFTVIDQNTPRAAADFITHAKIDVPSATNTAATARLLLALAADNYTDAAREMSKADVFAFVMANKDALIPAVRIGMNVANGLKAKVSPSMIATTVYLIRADAAHDVVEEFFARLGDGASLQKRSPILALREGLKNGEVATGYSNSKDRVRAGAAAIINAWNLWRAGKPCPSQTQLLYTRGAGFPKVRA